MHYRAVLDLAYITGDPHEECLFQAVEQYRADDAGRRGEADLRTSANTMEHGLEGLIARGAAQASDSSRVGRAIDPWGIHDD